jgi:crotonobetainyl-CoA:carnitine CoA-transferase CaiB-like acyl-CoA transferase
MSGFAAINGEPDGQPLLPPIALTDEVAGAGRPRSPRWWRCTRGVGQVVDVNLLESMFQLMGPLFSVYAATGELPVRLGSGIPYTVPRSTYRTSDGKWVAISTSAESVARRVMTLVGAGDDERFTTFEGRVAHRAEVDELVAAWVAQRPLAEVLATFDTAEAAAAPVYTMADIAADPHYAARGAVVELAGVPMQGLVARLSATPGRVDRPARPLGADTDEVLDELEH